MGRLPQFYQFSLGELSPCPFHRAKAEMPEPESAENNLPSK